MIHAPQRLVINLNINGLLIFIASWNGLALTLENLLTRINNSSVHEDHSVETLFLNIVNYNYLACLYTGITLFIYQPPSWALNNAFSVVIKEVHVFAHPHTLLVLFYLVTLGSINNHTNIPAPHKILRSISRTVHFAYFRSIFKRGVNCEVITELLALLSVSGDVGSSVVSVRNAWVA